MKKLDISKSFKDKKFRYGGYATLMTAVVLAILVIVNMVATKIDFKFDMTKEKMFSLSSQSTKVLGSLKDNVKIYGFYESGKENKAIDAILKKYVSNSKKVTLEYKDPNKYPQFAQQFTKNGDQVGEGTIVVSSNSRFIVFSENDFLNYSSDEQGNQKADSLGVEQKITNGILYVTSNKDFVVYNLKGHNEEELSTEVTSELKTLNYTVKELNLIGTDAKIEDGALLIIDSPKKDLSSDEVSKIKNLFLKSGKVMIMTDIMASDLTNFKELLAFVGVSVNNAPIVEGNTQNSANNPLYLLPNIQSHDITSPFLSAKTKILMPGSQGVNVLSVKKSSISIEPLLVTSANSWAKKNLNATTAEKESGDFVGPFNVAVAVTNKSDDGDKNKDARAIVTGTSQFINSKVISADRTNLDFFMNSLNWLQGNKESISISPKSLAAESLNLNSFQAILMSGIFVIVIPGIILALGISVWLRRRHK